MPTIAIPKILFKRPFDIIVSSVVLILLFPILVISALLVFCTSKGPVIEVHRFLGYRGILCKRFKFRIMYQDSEERLLPVLISDSRRLSEWCRNCKLKNDPRITPVGKFLQKIRLNGFLQFLNVIKGDLSIIGPRPLNEDEVNYIDVNLRKKYSCIRPGIISLHTVYEPYHRHLDDDSSVLDKS